LPLRRVSGLLEGDHLPGLPTVESRRDLTGDPSGARLTRVVSEVCVAGGRGLAAMAEDGAEDWQAKPGRGANAGESMSFIPRAG